MFSKRRGTLENAIEESAIREEWHSSIISHLESFAKNQAENIRRKERELSQGKRSQESS